MAVDGAERHDDATRLGARLQAFVQRALGRPLNRDVARALAVRVGGMASALLLYLVLARGLPLAQFGIYALVLGWLNLLGLFATLGTDSAALRFLPLYGVRQQPGLAVGYLQFAARLSLLVGVPLALFAMLVVRHWFAAGTAAVAAAMLLSVPLIALIAQRQSVLRVSGSIVAALLPEQLLRPVFAAALALLFGFLWPPLDALAAGIALTLATLASFAIGGFLLRRAPLSWRGAAPQFARRAWLSTAVGLGLFGWLYALLRQQDLLLVGALADAEQAARYAIASRCADIALFVSLAVDVLIAPLVAQRHAEGDQRELARLIRRSGRLAAALSLPVVLLLALLSPWLLPIFGPAYAAALPAFLILIAGHALAVSCGYGAYLLTMTGRERIALSILATALVVNVLLCVLLIPVLGLPGAALACAGGSLCWRLGSAFVAWRVIGINAMPFGPLVRR